MEKNKIIYGGKVLLDLTNDTVSSDTLGKIIRFSNTAFIQVKGA